MVNGARFRSLFLLLFLIVFAAGCSDKTEDPKTDGDGDRDTLFAGVKGLALSPAGFPSDYSLLLEFFEEVGSMRNPGIYWNGPWRDDPLSSGSIPNAALLTAAQSTIYGYTPLIGFGWRAGETIMLSIPGVNETNDWTNEDARRLFLEMVTRFARDYSPPFLFLGNETDFYYEQDPIDYARWVEIYGEAFDSIKAASPSTRVGTSFQFEHIAGLGQNAGWDTDTHWGAIALHDLDKLDLVGITLYPFFHHERVSEIPADYLEPVFEQIGNRTLAVTETGWPGEELGDLETPWERSEAAQMAFVGTLFDLVDGHDVALLSWLFLHQPTRGGVQEWEVFAPIALRDSTHSDRAALAEWLSR